MNSKELKELIPLYQQQIKEYKYDIKVLFSEYDYKHWSCSKNASKINLLQKEIAKLYLKINQIRFKYWYFK